MWASSSGRDRAGAGIPRRIRLLDERGDRAYLSAEAANAEQSLLGVVNGMGLTAPAAALDGVNGFGATVAAPYQMLVSNTVANLQELGNGIAANPAPLLRQFVSNQQFFGQTIATGLHALGAPNRLLVADFTYVKLITGVFVYVAFVIDAVRGAIGTPCSVSTRQIGATPESVPVINDEFADRTGQRRLRGSLSRTKKDVAALRISMVCSSSALRRLSARISAAASLETPSRWPSSI
jgi:hypothetical protein